MLAAYTELKHAQKVKKLLQEKRLLHYEYLPVKELDHIYFPITKKTKIPNAKIVNTKFRFPQKPQHHTIESLLKNKLTKKQLSIIPKSQEVVGSILILEIPDTLKKKEKVIAQAYLQLIPQVTTVVKKAAVHSGDYRTRKVTILAGKRTKETTHRENGIKLTLNLEKVYYSARSANERLRIAKQIKKLETVLVMFSGAGPFPLVIAKNSPAKTIHAVELNPLGHQYALQNVEQNNLTDKINVLLGDVRKIVPKIKKRFDRIAMPLPKTGEEFLDVALKKSKPGTIIHLYAFLHENDVAQHVKKVKEICKQNKHPVRVLRKVKCGQFSPGTFRMCFDLKVLK